MASQGGTDGDLGGFAISDLSDHDHVRVLPHNVPQSGRER